MTDENVCFYCGIPYDQSYGCTFCNRPTHPEKPGKMGEFRPEDKGPVRFEESQEYLSGQHDDALGLKPPAGASGTALPGAPRTPKAQEPSEEPDVS